MRALLGWLRAETRHCSMAAIPTIAEEDARRPNRERDNLVRERTRIVNRIKAVLARFGVHTFRPTLRKAADKIDSLRTVEGTPLPENTRAELRRSLGRLRLLHEQIHEIEHERLRRLAAAPKAATDPCAMMRLLARVIGVGVETADMLVNEIFLRGLRDRAVARYAGLTGAPDESGEHPLTGRSAAQRFLNERRERNTGADARDILHGFLDRTGRMLQLSRASPPLLAHDTEPRRCSRTNRSAMLRASAGSRPA